MRLKNILIVVTDMEKSTRFYKELFGLQVLADHGGNVMMTEGLVLQDMKYWHEALQKECIAKNHMSELYFQEGDIDSFVKKLQAYPEPIEYVTPLVTQDWGQRVIRIYDPDGNLIEVGTPSS